MNTDFLLRWMEDLLHWLGVDSGSSIYQTVAATVVILLFTIFIWWGAKFILLRTLKLRKHILSQKSEYIINKQNMNRVAIFIGILVLYTLLPLAFKEYARVIIFIKRGLDIVLTWTIMAGVIITIRLSFEAFYRRKKYTHSPLKGVMQVIILIVYALAIITIIAILIDKSPSKLFTGLGASAAVLSLVFKDSILNFISGIKLTSDKMLTVGDWIEVPDQNIDGNIIDVSLNTVKVRNWDNTVSTIPPYVLTSGTFKNWESMVNSGGRRISRSLLISFNSMKFCTPELLDKISQIEYMSDYIALVRSEKEEENIKITNLELFRVYLLKYIENQPSLNKKMTYMVRQLQSEEVGLPLEIYMFTTILDWVGFENLQSKIMEHTIGMIPLFELKIYQRTLQIGDNTCCIDDPK